MSIQVSSHNPTPESVSIRSHELDGKPRRVVEIDGVAFYGSPEALVDVFAKALEVLGYATFAAGMRPVRQPEPLSGDYTFLGSPAPAPGDVVAIGQMGGPRLEIEVTDVIPGPAGGAVTGQIVRVVDAAGETVGEMTVSRSPDGLVGDMVISDEMADVIRGDVDGLSIGFEPGHHDSEPEGSIYQDGAES